MNHHEKETGAEPSREPMSAGRPHLQPNILMINGNAVSSTFDKLRLDHSVLGDSRLLNCLFNRTNFEGSSFHGCDFDGSLLENCSLRGVELRDCDTEGLVINGIRVGDLFKLAMAR
jgi:uncharacterized protein YjbI with pentapeptide repeats